MDTDNARTHAHARAIIVGRHLLWVLFLCTEPYKTVHGLGWEIYPHASAKIMERDERGGLWQDRNGRNGLKTRTTLP